MSDWPKLSETMPHLRAASHLQCGNCTSVCFVEIWEELGEADQPQEPERIFISLCPSCSESIIEPHPRCYRKTATHEPMLGAMPVCGDCEFRSALKCTNPLRKSAGGKGVNLRFPEPSVAFVDGRDKQGKRTGWRQKIFHKPVICR